MNPAQNKSRIIFIIGGIALFFMVLVSVLFFSTPPKPIIPVPTPSGTPIAYNPDSLEKDYQRIENRKQLSASDQQVRTKLISSAGKNGIVYQNNEFVVKYVPAPNAFLVELLLDDGEKAKKDALGWFSSQGLSTQGICNLPVSLYLNYKVSQNYSLHNKQFDPNIPGCQ